MLDLRWRSLVLLLCSQVSAWAPLRARVSGCRGYALSVAKEPASAQTQVETAVDWTIAATAQALRLSERDTVAFLQGALSPKQMSVALLRKELDVRGYTEESAMCESAKDLRDLLQIARRQEAEDEAGLLRKAKKQTPADKELIDRYLALEKDDTIQGNVDVGELAPSDDLPEELLLSELQRRAPKEAEALLADDASYSAEELKWALLAAREEKPLPAVEEGETDAAPVAEKRPSEMSVREILKELEARGALDVPTVLERKPLLEAVRSKRQSGEALSDEDMDALHKEQTLFLHLKRAQVWDVVQRTHLDMLPDQAGILADTWEIILRESGLLSSSRRYSDLTADDVLDNLPVDITLGQYQTLSFDSRVDVAINDPVVAKVMKLIEQGKEADAMDILDREPAAQRAFHEFAQAVEDAGFKD
uniref:Uncharacterized protein n=1 Tax=Pinguiococcus pyrenoidosus TaxID=172671 RepID=A0A7R9U8W6_9STRA